MDKQCTIAFDWNGTLKDDSDLALACSNRALTEAGGPAISMDTFQRAFDVPIQRYYFNLGYDAAWQSANLERVNHRFLRYFEDGSAHIPLREAAEEVLGSLRERGHRAVILSNHFTDKIWEHLERHKIAPLISDVWATNTGEAHLRTPKGRKLLNRMQAEGLSRDQVVVVGDTVEEVVIASGIGSASIAITGGYASQERLEGAGPTHLVHDMGQMKRAFAQLGLL